jgi:hypothetical protein
VVPNAAIEDQVGDSSSIHLQACVYSRPDAVLFKGKTYATLYATIDADCGYAEIYADKAAELYDACCECQRSRGSSGPNEPENEMSPLRPAAQVDCLSCGAKIPEAASACPACGWTWGDEQITPVDGPRD